MIVVCSYVTNSLNGLWLSLGWAAGFMLPLIIATNQVVNLRNVKNPAISMGGVRVYPSAPGAQQF